MNSPYMHPTHTVTVTSLHETETLATTLARYLLPGDLVRLEGTLGAGKTTFTQGLLKALGHTGEVPSPTYTLMQTYETTRIPVAHVDCYRLENPEELESLGLEAYRTHGVIVAEWPEKGGHLLRADTPDFLAYHIQEMNNPGTLTIHIHPTENSTERTVTFHGSRSWQRRFAMMFPELRRPQTEENRKKFLTSQGLGNAHIESLGADWSTRSYWRVRKEDGTALMLMDAAPPLEGVAEFANVAEWYRGMGLRTPVIYGKNEAEGYLLTEDLGNNQLAASIARGEDPTSWYEAMASVLTTQCQNPAPEGARRYTAKDWWIEAARFTDWYMPMARGYATTPEERAEFQRLWLNLFPKMMELPQGLMMWDCQSANLMLLGKAPSIANLGLIDIQDARMAPVMQDAAILLRDDRRGQDSALEKHIVNLLSQKLNVAEETLQTGLDVCSLHHCCRILGGVARLVVRDGRTRMAGAIKRRWQIAHQSFSNPLLAEIAAFMAPWEIPGIAKVESLTPQEGKAA